MNIDVLTLFPDWFAWFRAQRHVPNALAAGHTVDAVDVRGSTPLKWGQVDDTPFGGGAGMGLRVDVMEAALRAPYHVGPGRPTGRRRGGDGAARRRHGGGAARPLRRRSGRAARSAARDRADARGPAVGRRLG